MKCKLSEEEKHEIQKNLSLCQLKIENFTDGWKNYKSRLFSEGYLSLSNLPIFNINSNYKKILILPEQGIGDEIFFSRFFNDLQKSQRKIYYLCCKKLKSLFKTSFPHITFLDKKKFIYEKKYQEHCFKKYCFDSQIHIGDLASFFIYNNSDVSNRSHKFLSTNKVISKLIKKNCQKIN